MKLTKKEKEIILAMGYENSDLQQIEEVQNAIKLTDEKNKIVGKKKARTILGLEKYLSGLARASFHWSALRKTDDEKQFIYFDAHNYFKN